MTDEQLNEIYERHHKYAEWDLVPNKPSAISAMKEAVEKGSIGFAVWCEKNIAMKNHDGLFIVATYSGLNFNKAYTIEEIYAHYIKQLEK